MVRQLSSICMVFFSIAFGLNAATATSDWPKLDLIKKDHNVLLVTLGGAGMFEPGPGDGIIALGSEFTNYRNDMVTVSLPPDFSMNSTNQSIVSTVVVCNAVGRTLLNMFIMGAGTTVCVAKTVTTLVNGGVVPVIDYTNYTPNASDLAKTINDMAVRMSPTRKVILVGKSMGACLLIQANDILNSTYHLPVDLFVIVDASCDPKQHNEVKDVQENVKKVMNFYERKSGELQNGYKINYVANPSLNSQINIDVNQLSNNSSIGTLCNDNPGHMEIDNCPKLLAYIKNKIIETMGPNLAFINLLLD